MPGHEYVSLHDINLPMSQPRSAQRSQQLQLSVKKRWPRPIRDCHDDDLTTEFLLPFPWWLEDI